MHNTVQGLSVTRGARLAAAVIALRSTSRALCTVSASDSSADTV